MLTTVCVLVLPVAAAQADSTWTGGSTTSKWSDAGNWSGGAVPTGATGELTFPGGVCGGCYSSQNDLSGVGVTSLVLGNPSSQYQLTGKSFTVGSGGINDSPGGGAGDVISAPIALSGSQTWVVGTTVGNGYDSLTLLGGVTGGTSAVTMSIPNGDLFIDSDMEAGPVTSEGPGGLHIGGAPGLNEPGSINGSNGQPVTVNAGILTPNPGSTTGPLSIAGGTLLRLGTNKANTDATTLQVNGSATLGSSTTTQTFIDNNGSTAGGDFSQLSASGNISLGGTLDLRQAKLNNNTGTCVALAPGDVATLVTTTGTLSGTFSNAPDGATVTMASSCQSPTPQVQIHYTANSVTATVLGPGTPTVQTTTSLAAPNPSSSSTNQTVTLTATVTTNGTGTIAPAGTVAFSAKAGTISGCTAQPLTVSGSSGTATCTTSFPASASPESLTAAFNPAGGSSQAASTSSPPQTPTVSRAATTTALSASTTQPIVGTSVTYTATVTPANPGPVQPSGTVAFLDGGTPISGCTARQLAGSQATCTVTYFATGSHAITAAYKTDANFTGSTSQPTTVTVEATATATALATPSPSPSSTNQTVTLTATVTTSGAGAPAPDGTVAFLSDGSTVAGCAGQALTVTGSSGTATCTTSFTANGSPVSLTAAFNPTNGSGQAASTSSPQSLIVNRAATATAVQVSSTSPPAGANVTYTAMVSPAITGASQPAGTVAFLDGGSPVAGCTAKPLSAGSSSLSAGCTVSYPAAGSHAITATYAGDGNFSGSSSPLTTVTVQGTPTGSGVGTGGRRDLVLSRVAQSHIRWRERQARPARDVLSVPLGTRFTFNVSNPSRVTFAFIQILPGRRATGRCLAPTKATRGARACHRTRTRGRLIRSVGGGTHHLSFDGRLGRTTLSSGNYAVAITAAGTSGARSHTIALHFTIVG